jgi:hypothetical protein
MCASTALSAAVTNAAPVRAAATAAITASRRLREMPSPDLSVTVAGAESRAIRAGT